MKGVGYGRGDDIIKEGSMGTAVSLGRDVLGGDTATLHRILRAPAVPGADGQGWTVHFSYTD